jgi:hypothetical protein
VGIQSAINLGCACFLFPQTVSHKYIASLVSVLKLVKTGIGEQASLLSISPMDVQQWQEYKIIQSKVQEGKATFIAMIADEEFLDKEISFSRIKGENLVVLKHQVRKLLSGLGTSLKQKLTQAVSIIGITQLRQRLPCTCNLVHQHPHQHHDPVKSLLISTIPWSNHQDIPIQHLVFISHNSPLSIVITNPLVSSKVRHIQTWKQVFNPPSPKKHLITKIW